jgi:hypothetical protein
LEDKELFTLYDGRSHFWQWDANQKLVTTTLPLGTEVHFYHDSDEKLAFTMLVEQEASGRVCTVPNALFKKPGSIKVYVYTTDKFGNRTTHRKVFVVKPREMPSGYIYTETETYTLKTALQRAVNEIKIGPVGPPGPKGETGVGIASFDKIAETAENIFYELVLTDGRSEILAFKHGAPGLNGRNGKDGKDGKDGADGKDGKDGKDGYTPVYGVDYYTEEEKEALSADILEMLKNTTTSAKIGEVTLLADSWAGEGNLYSQVVEIEGVTENSQVDLTPDVQQLAVFYDKDLTFVTENEEGVVTVYAIGQKPANDYTIQVTITEVEI